MQLPSKWGPSPCLALLTVLLTALRGTLSALALSTPGGRVAHRGPDTSSQEKDNAHCVHLLVLGEFLRTLYPSYRGLEEMLCNTVYQLSISPPVIKTEKIQSMHFKQKQFPFLFFFFFSEKVKGLKQISD